MNYDLIILGGGPAGVAAAVYAGRKLMRSALVSPSFGGQSVVSREIENWIGSVSISGLELAKSLEAHARSQETISFFVPDEAVSLLQSDDGNFSVSTKRGETLVAPAVILAVGARRRHLGVPGEKEFEGRGVAYCATCDAPFFRDKAVSVVGGGNSGLESAVELLPFASEVSIIVRGDSLSGDQKTQEELLENPKVRFIFQSEVLEIRGEKSVEEVVYKNTSSGDQNSLKVGGVFVEIGSEPNTDFVKGLVPLTPNGEIITDPRTSATKVLGIFAAGDATDQPFRQNNIAAGDAVKAILSAHKYILERGSK